MHTFFKDDDGFKVGHYHPTKGYFVTQFEVSDLHTAVSLTALLNGGTGKIDDEYSLSSHLLEGDFLLKEDNSAPLAFTLPGTAGVR